MGIETLIPDYTLFIQMALFFTCFFVLNTFVFKPYLELQEIRRSKTSGLKEKAISEKEKADELRTQYDAFMKEERKKVAAFVEEGRRKVGDEEKAILATARAAASEELNKARAKSASDLAKAREQLAPLVTEYSSQIVSKILAKKVEIGSHYSDRVKSKELESTLSG